MSLKLRLRTELSTISDTVPPLFFKNGVFNGFKAWLTVAGNIVFLKEMLSSAFGVIIKGADAPQSEITETYTLMVVFGILLWFTPHVLKPNQKTKETVTGIYVTLIGIAFSFIYIKAMFVTMYSNGYVMSGSIVDYFTMNARLSGYVGDRLHNLALLLVGFFIFNKILAKNATEQWQNRAFSTSFLTLLGYISLNIYHGNSINFEYFIRHGGTDAMVKVMMVLIATLLYILAAVPKSTRKVMFKKHVAEY
ncbi:hypothetical protein BCU83_16340 [Vibrio breoganii]|uniref:hypothetical protein n=1 Tax=Vibrio breoganii TaxID=553239 RepID=UPI000C839E0D|nr:hypothetical protein [Vibrio breoganii]PMG76595.1 hypothetical protein BCU83_16340 [Vibrio breoganii]